MNLRGAGGICDASALVSLFDFTSRGTFAVVAGINVEMDLTPSNDVREKGLGPNGGE